MTEIDKPLGLYVHIPFCKRKCNYCDFCSFAETPEQRAEYISALLSEIEGYRGTERVVDTVFFGGGTPSVLTPQEFSRIAAKLREIFKISQDAEFTVECNPKTLSAEKLAAFRAAGVNRLSIGLQSIHENELKFLGRIHTFQDFLESYGMAKNAGFENINLDLMYGIPAQSKESFSETLDTVIALAPTHISVYGLIIEPGTPFYEKRTELPLPTEDEECDMYEIASAKLSEAGFRHYEISNYSKGDSLCRHNLKYWHSEEYIGLGLAAHSYFEGERFSNTESLTEYRLGDFSKSRVRDVDREKDDPFEYAMLNFRLDTGVSLEEYKVRFGLDFLDGREEKIKNYIKLGLMSKKNDALCFTEKGFYLSNSILSDLL